VLSLSGPVLHGGIIPDPFRKELLAMGWQAEPLGPAVRLSEGSIGAFMVHVRADTPARLRWTRVHIGEAERIAA